MILLTKGIVLLVGFLVGIAGGTAVATPVIALINLMARDGPLFPPPFVALGLLAIPLALLLLPVQIAATTYELTTKRSLDLHWFTLAVAAGATSGIVWFLVLRSSQSTPIQFAFITAFGVFQALCAFGTHFAAHRLRLGEPPPQQAK